MNNFLTTENTKIMNFPVIAKELEEIFKYLDINVRKKIPIGLINKLNEIKDDNYSFTIDKSKQLCEQNVSYGTKELLSAIYLEYCCDEPRKTELTNKCKENEQIKPIADINIPENSGPITDKALITMDETVWYKKVVHNIKLFVKKIFNIK